MYRHFEIRGAMPFYKTLPSASIEASIGDPTNSLAEGKQK
jgi:hypothetical protein